MQDDMAALIAIVKELYGMFPPGQQAKVDQIRADLAQLEVKYASGVAAWNDEYSPAPGPPPIPDSPAPGPPPIPDSPAPTIP